jgi:hypothetical protein
MKPQQLPSKPSTEPKGKSNRQPFFPVSASSFGRRDNIT